MVREVYVVSEGHPPEGECVLGVYESRDTALDDAHALAREEAAANNIFEVMGDRRSDDVIYFYVGGWGAYIVVRKHEVIPKLR